MQMEEVEKSPDGREVVLCDARRPGVNCRQVDVDRDGGHNYECARAGGRVRSAVHEVRNKLLSSRTR